MKWNLLRMIAPFPEGGGEGGSSGTPAVPAVPAPVAAPAEPRIDHKEIVGLRTETRELHAAVMELLKKSGAATAAPAPAAAPADPAAMAAIEGIKFTLDLERALRKHGVPDGPVADLITAAATAAKPADLAAYVAQYAKIGSGTPPAPVVPTATAPSNTGPPAANPSTASIPDNPLEWSPDVLAKFTPDEFHQALAKYEQKSGRGNPFASMRQRAEAARKR